MFPVFQDAAEGEAQEEVLRDMGGVAELLPLTEGRAHDLASETGEIIKELKNGI